MPCSASARSWFYARQRQPHIRPIRHTHLIRQDADDRVCLTIQTDGHSNDCAVPVEASTPQPIANHCDVVVAALILGLDEASSENRIDAEQWEQAARRQRGSHLL